MGLLHHKRYQRVRGIDSDRITDSGEILEPPRDAPYATLELATRRTMNHWTRAISTLTPYAKMLGVPILYKVRVVGLHSGRSTVIGPTTIIVVMCVQPSQPRSYSPYF